jgi:hypothetical protein
MSSSSFTGKINVDRSSSTDAQGVAELIVGKQSATGRPASSNSRSSARYTRFENLARETPDLGANAFA